MGSGKSTVGRLLALQLDYDFVDTDEMIEQQRGISIAQIFQQDGEFAFRNWERIVARDLAAQTGLVIATGGRMMLDEENAALLSQNSKVICLTAEPETILERVAGEERKRPLLDVADPIVAINRMLSKRKAAYGRFHQISTDGKSPLEIGREIIQWLNEEGVLAEDQTHSEDGDSPNSRSGGKRMYFCDVAEREAKEVVPGIRIRTFWETNMLLSVVDLNPRAKLPAHSHPHEQAGTVISGQLQLTIAGKTRMLLPGDAYIIPGGIEHSAVSGDTPTRVIDIFSPVREEYQY